MVKGVNIFELIRVYLLCMINIILYDMYKFSKKKNDWIINLMDLRIH